MTPPDAVFDDEDVILLGTSERLQRQARTQRRRRLWIVGVVTLGVLTTALVVVNVGLRRSETASTSTVVAASPAEAPAAPVAVAATEAVTPSEPVVTTTVPAKERTPAPAAAAKKRAVEPTPPPVAAAMTEPDPDASRFVTARVLEPRPQAAAVSVVKPQITDSAKRVAQWMTTTYGKADAERRAEQAVTLYPEGDERVEHWRGVLAQLRATSAP